MKSLNDKSWIPKTVLALSAHADDIELGAGGTIHKWTCLGARVYSFIFSTLKNKEVRLPEIAKASQILGIAIVDVVIQDYPNRRFPEFRQDILQNMVELQSLKPDIVLVPTTTDRHQDHEVVVAEAIRAFKKTTIIGYEAVWNMTQSNLPLTVGLSSRDIDAKLSSVAAHKSEDYRPYMNPDFIKSLAMVRGLASGFSFGESYEVIRWIM